MTPTGPEFNHTCRKVLIPIYALLLVDTIITILLDSAMDFEYLNW